MCNLVSNFNHSYAGVLRFNWVFFLHLIDIIEIFYVINYIYRVKDFEQKLKAQESDKEDALKRYVT